MPISYQIELARGLIRTHAVGPATLEEVAEHLRQLEVDPQFQKPLDVLLDLTACTSLPDRYQLEGIANQLKSLGGRDRFRRCAIVAHRAAMYGMSRMFEVLAEEQFVATHAFQTVPEAEVWLTEGKLPAAEPNGNHDSTRRSA
jgi:hypothetical protein